MRVVLLYPLLGGEKLSKHWKPDMLETIIYNKGQIFLDSTEIRHKLSLAKMNGNIIADLPSDSLINSKKSLTSINEITLQIPRYCYDGFTLKKSIYPVYNMIKNEREVYVYPNGDNLNVYDVYVIKNIERDNFENLLVTCKSKETKLKNIEIFLEDVFIWFGGSDETDGDAQILDIATMLYEKTG